MIAKRTPTARVRSRGLCRRITRAVAACVALSFAASPVLADSLVQSTGRSQSLSDVENTIGFKNGSFIAAPIPSRNIELGFGVALVGAYLFKMDEESSNSFIGLGYFESENGSVAYGAGTDLSFRGNDWKISAYAGQADVNYNMYIADIPVPLSQDGTLGDLQILHQVLPNTYLGGKLQYMQSSIVLNDGGLIPPELAPHVALELVTGSVLANYDTRDDTFYPTTGTLVSGTVSYGTDLDGLIDDYQKAVFKAAAYYPLTGRTVLAGLVTGCASAGDVPFFANCAVGGTDNMRGYAPLRYVGDQMLSAQIELRHRLSDRFGVVAFAGAGRAESGFDPTATDLVHAAAGFGVRVRLSKKFPMDYSVDVAFDEAGERSVYLYLGQRF